MRFGLGLLMPEFCQFLTEQSAHDMSVFSFPDNKFNKYRWIFMKLGMCLDVVQIWFGIANGQISSIFDRVICQWHIHVFVSEH